MCNLFNSYEESLHLCVCKLAKYVRDCVVFWKNLHSWQKFYTTVGRDGRDKFQVCHPHPHNTTTNLISKLYNDNHHWIKLKVVCLRSKQHSLPLTGYSTCYICLRSIAILFMIAIFLCLVSSVCAFCALCLPPTILGILAIRSWTCNIL